MAISAFSDARVHRLAADYTMDVHEVFAALTPKDNTVLRAEPGVYETSSVEHPGTSLAPATAGLHGARLCATSVTALPAHPEQGPDLCERVEMRRRPGGGCTLTKTLRTCRSPTPADTPFRPSRPADRGGPGGRNVGVRLRGKATNTDPITGEEAAQGHGGGAGLRVDRSVRDLNACARSNSPRAVRAR